MRRRPRLRTVVAAFAAMAVLSAVAFALDTSAKSFRLAEQHLQYVTSGRERLWRLALQDYGPRCKVHDGVVRVDFLEPSQSGHWRIVTIADLDELAAQQRPEIGVVVHCRDGAMAAEIDDSLFIKWRRST